MEVRIQSVVVEFILNHVDVLFSSKLSSVIRESAGMFPQGREPVKIQSVLLAPATPKNTVLIFHYSQI